MGAYPPRQILILPSLTLHNLIPHSAYNLFICLLKGNQMELRSTVVSKWNVKYKLTGYHPFIFDCSETNCGRTGFYIK